MSRHLPLGDDDPAQVDGYRLLGRLGEGGQGRVYLAADAHGGHVALKVLLPELAADPVARARIAEQTDLTRYLPSSAAVRVLAARADHDPPYVVSEYVPGPSLAGRVRDSGPVRGAELEDLLVGTLTALVAVHDGGVVHHDLKPANILLGPDGPRFADFDLALREGRRDPTANEDGVLGSAAFLAPERLDAGPAVAASDVFAWAATMVFAATGRSPFHAPHPAAVLRAVEHDPPDLAGTPVWVRPLLESCLAKDPRQRPTAAAASAQLEQARHPTPAWGSASPPVAAPRATPRTAPRRPPAWFSARRPSSPPAPPAAPAPARSGGLSVAGYTLGAMGLMGALVVVAMTLVVALALVSGPSAPHPWTPPTVTSPGAGYGAMAVRGPTVMRLAANGVLHSWTAPDLVQPTTAQQTVLPQDSAPGIGAAAFSADGFFLAVAGRSTPGSAEGAPLEVSLFSTYGGTRVDAPAPPTDGWYQATGGHADVLVSDSGTLALLAIPSLTTSGGAAPGEVMVRPFSADRWALHLHEPALWPSSLALSADARWLAFAVGAAGPGGGRATRLLDLSQPDPTGSARTLPCTGAVRFVPGTRVAPPTVLCPDDAGRVERFTLYGLRSTLPVDLVCSTAVSPTGAAVACLAPRQAAGPSREHVVRLASLQSQRPAVDVTVAVDGAPPNALVWTPTGSHLLVGTADAGFGSIAWS